MKKFLALGLVLLPVLALAEIPSGSLPAPAYLKPVGTPLTLNVDVAGTEPLNFLWFKDGRVLGKATSPQLEIASAGPSHAGSYRLRVSNASGVWTSPPIRVGVYEVPKAVTRRAGTPLTLHLRTWGAGVKVYWTAQFLDLTLPNPVYRIESVPQGETGYEVGVRMEGLHAPDSLGEMMYQTVTGVGKPLGALPYPAFHLRLGEPFGPVSVFQEQGVTYHAEGLPPGVTLEGFNVLGTPTEAGTFEATLWASDGYGSSPRTTQVFVVGGQSAGIQGDYAGIVPTAKTGSGLGALLQVNVTYENSFTAKLKSGDETVSLTGTLTANPNTPLGRVYETVLPLPASAAWPAGHMLFLRNVPEEVALEAFIGTATPVYPPDLWMNLSPPAQLQGGVSTDPTGKHVMYLMPEVPQEGARAFTGSGFATGTVSAQLQAVMVGSLPDGTRFTAGGMLRGPALLLVYMRLNANNDHLLGEVHLQSQPPSPGGAVLEWVRHPDPRQRIAPEGFTLNLYGVCERYQPPRPGVSLFSDPTRQQSEGTIAFVDGGLGAPFTTESFPFRLNRNNQVTMLPPNPAQVSLKFTPATGLFNGQFTVTEPMPGNANRTTTRRISFQGVYLPQQLTGYGFFLAPQAPESSVTRTRPPTASPIYSGQVFISPF